jgi:VWFA-related protein
VWQTLAISSSAVAISLAQSGGQQPQTAAELTQRDAPFTFSTGVNLVLVPVVVRDAQGHAIGTLQKEDFQLFDSGKLQPITKFSVEKAEAPPVLRDTSIETDANGNPQARPGGPAAQPIAGHFIMWLFDDVHLSQADLAQTRAAAKRVLKESFAPGTRAAIYTTSGHNSLDFTDDRDKLDATLDLIQTWPTVPKDASCLDAGYFQADRVINGNDPDATLAAQVDFLSSCPEAAPAATAISQAATAGQAVVAGYVQSSIAEPLRMALLKEVEIGFQDTRNTLLVLKGLVRRMSAMPGSRTIVMVSPGFYLVTDHRTDESDVIDAAIRNNVVISSLDARGLYSLTPGGTADTRGGVVDPNTINIKAGFERQAALANMDIMQEFATATGGTFIHDDNDFVGGLKLVAAQPEYIYVLGFAPQNLKLDGSYHKLRITLRNGAALQLQARRGYFERKHLADPAEQAKAEITEAFFSRDEIRGLPVEFNTQFFRTGDYKARLSILARIDVRHLRFRKTDGRNDNTLTVVGGLFDRDGKFVTGTQKIVDLRLRDQTLDQLPESGITVKTNLDVASGDYVVRVVVRDSEGQIMSALNGAVAIP